MSSSSRTRVEEAIRIPLPPDEVWGVVADPTNDLAWCRKVKSVHVMDERQWQVIHKPMPLRPPRELELKQLEAEPPHRLALRQEDAAAVSTSSTASSPPRPGRALRK